MTALLWRDVKRVCAALLVGCGAAAAGELVMSLLVGHHYPGLATAIRFVFLDAALFGALFLFLAPIASGAAVLVRLVLWTDSRERAATFDGFFAPAPPYTGPRPRAAWLWGGALAVMAYLVASTVLGAVFAARFKEQQLSAIVQAGLQLVLFGLCGGLAFVVAMALRRVAARLDRRLGRWNPFGHPVAAAGGLLLVALPVGLVVLKKVPQMAPLIPWRHMFAAALVALGAHAATHVFARRGSLLPAAGRARRIAWAGLGVGGALLLGLGLTWIGADPATKGFAVAASPPVESLIGLVRVATDFDRDGYGTLLGENDCAPFDRNIHPLARDIPDDGIDQNCDGRDFSLGRMPSYRTGVKMPVPEGFRQRWNVLFITVDATRYDHTTMGGYVKKTGRDTTPNLARLTARSVSFSFANAPSAGTMASVPAIMTSKFFHSGIALDEHVKKGMPPRLKKENLLLAELFHDAGYRTGAILTHEYFNDWGFEQGFDSFDKEMGAKPNPFSITSPEVTDRALAWIGQQSGDKPWFLWLHYLDPHGRYVAHPGETSYGTSEEDLYDGEIAFTDKHIGRLLDQLDHMAAAERTIVVVTSDHGDGFMEHGFINHGQALYRELLNVPMIVFIPNIEPRLVGGAVSNLDLVPTLIDLCGLKPPAGATFEGESLVPQLFYKQDASKRVVFSETNYPKPLRAAVTARYKLIYDIKSNVYELYDLKKDPWEKNNIWLSDKSGFDQMKAYLDDWLERVYYARDPVSNQAMEKIGEYLLDKPPAPAHPLSGVTFDGGAIDVVGWDASPDPVAPGGRVELVVYFKAARRPAGDLAMQAEAWHQAGKASPPVKTSPRAAGGGLLPTSRWRPGEYVREKFSLGIPGGWGDPSGGQVEIGLRMEGATTHAAVSREGPAPGGPGGEDAVSLGKVTLSPGAAPLVPPARPAPGAPAPGTAAPPVRTPATPPQD